MMICILFTFSVHLSVTKFPPAPAVLNPDYIFEYWSDNGKGCEWV